MEIAPTKIRDLILHESPQYNGNKPKVRISFFLDTKFIIKEFTNNDALIRWFSAMDKAKLLPWS